MDGTNQDSSLNIDSALILCAGYGTRLRPLTDFMPKPLLPIKGKPLLLSIISNLAKCGIKKFYVNTCHLHDVFEKELEKLWGIPSIDENNLKKFCTTLPEGEIEIRILGEYPNILDTGGAVKNAVKYIGTKNSIFVHNGDILFDADLKDFAERTTHATKYEAATICLRDNPQGNVCVKANNIVDFRFTTKAEHDKTCAFTGLFVAHSQMLEATKKYDGENFSTVDVFLKLIAENKYKLGAYIENNGLWSDIGSPSAYIQANKNFQPTRFDRLATLTEKGITVSTPSFIEKGASTRSFMRFTDANARKLVACFYPEEKREDFLYANIARFLYSCGVSVPQIILEDEEERMFLMEDGGSDDLLLLKNRGDLCQKLYEDFVDELKKIHTTATQKFLQSPFELMPKFDDTLYTWEQTYFFDNCVKIEFGLDVEIPQDEFDTLSRELQACEQTLVHRDAQSQNAMVLNNKLTLIDFQGMRLGCPMYDLASVLFDPYVELSNIEREKLFMRYIGENANSQEIENLQKLFHLAAVERLLQALGAYGFLSNTRGLTQYKEYFAPALKNLQYCANKAGLQKIEKIAKDCLEKLSLRNTNK